MDSESELISLVSQLIILKDLNRLWLKLISQITSLLRSMDLNQQPKPLSELMSITSQLISFFTSMDLDSHPKPLSELISFITQRVNTTDSDPEPEKETDLLDSLLVTETLSLEPTPELVSLITQRVNTTDSDPKQEKERKLLESLVTDTLSLEPTPELISLVNQLVNTTDSDPEQEKERKLLESLVTDTLSLDPEPELISLIYQIFSIVISIYSNSGKLVCLSPQAEVYLEQGKFHVIENVSLKKMSRINKWKCLPGRWDKYKLNGEEGVTYFHCQNCNGEQHKDFDKVPVEIKHTLHPKHSLQLVWFNDREKITRKCYCCDEYLKKMFYYCSVCDYAMNIACVEKQPVISIDHSKWHEHALALFPRKACLTCDVCGLDDPTCPFYICPPCDFVIHQSCISLPSVIRISRHRHRISFTPSFDQRDWFCGVCRRKIDNGYGGYSCIKDGCCYAAHSRCATQSNVWDGIELEGVVEDVEEEVDEPFVKISDGIIQHFSHQHHHLRLDEDTSRDYDENRLCQACVMPIFFGNFYSCMQCDFILHEACANLSRKLHHPVHPHMLTLVAHYDDVRKGEDMCSTCTRLCVAGFYYECGKKECYFKLHVQCGTVSEPLVHESHMHPLFLTSKPGEYRKCSVSTHTRETFNCIECNFVLCFECATLPQKVMYKHDKHMLSLSYGEETSAMTYWCELCEKKLNTKERFYKCDEYCCVTLHIDCLFGTELYMMPGSSWFYLNEKVDVLPNNQHMSRPICSLCKKRCPYKVVFQLSGFIYCSRICYLFDAVSRDI